MIKNAAPLLFLEPESADFWRDLFQVEPVIGRAVHSLSLQWHQVFNVLPKAHAKGVVRYINEHTAEHGEDPATVLASLENHGSTLSPASFEAQFAEGRYSYAIQEFESFDPQVLAIAELLRQATGCAVSVTAFVSPPLSRATRIHYDKNDVFAYQVSGEKLWETYHPVDPMPNLRTPNVPVDEVELLPHAAYSLQHGHLLYLPRGWIHRVENRAQEPSLHLSFVVFTDAWVSVFANLMDAAYAVLREHPDWRRPVSVGAGAGVAAARVETMADQLKSTMLQMLDGRPQHYFDHCRNDNAQLDCVAQGRASVISAGERDDLLVEPTGAHYLVRHHEAAHSVRISTDGTTFLPVRRSALAAAEAGLSKLADFAHSSVAGSPEAAAEALDVLVIRSGAFQLSNNRPKEG